MESFELKKILCVLVFLSESFFYLNIRLSYKNKKKYVYNGRRLNSNISYYLVDRCAAHERLTISFDPKLTFEENAHKLIEYAKLKSNQYYHICDSSLFEACKSGLNYTKCETMDLRAFLVGYFDEQKYLCREEDSRALLTSAVDQSDPSSFIYNIFADDESILNDNTTQNQIRFQVFGSMIAAAALTETYLGIGFEDKFFYENIDVSSYDKSRHEISQGIFYVLGGNYYNHKEDTWTWNRNRNRFINFDAMFNSKETITPFPWTVWRRNSDCTNRIFWRALKELTNEEQGVIFTKATGYKGFPVPIGERKMIPRTQIITGRDKEMFPFRFLIVINPDWSTEQLVVKFKIEIKK